MKHRGLQFIALLSPLGLLWFSGCAALSGKQQGQITSSPSGATVYFMESRTNKKWVIGTTPTNAWLKAGSLNVYLIAELDGYERERWLLPTTVDISHHFELEKAFVTSIIKEHLEGQYDSNYKKAVIAYLAKAEKVISSPRMLAGSAASDAKAEFERLSIDYPQQSRSAVNRALNKLDIKVNTMPLLSEELFNSDYERDKAAEIKTLILEVRLGLGLP